MSLPAREFALGVLAGLLTGWGAWYLWLGLREWWDRPSRHDEGE